MSSEFESFWRPFIRAFQTICVSHHSVFRPHLRTNFRRSLPFWIYFTVFATAHLSLTLAITSKQSSDQSPNQLEYKESTLMHYINILSIISHCGIFVVTYVEVLFYGKREAEMCEKFKEIADIFAVEFDHVPNFKVRRVHYMREPVLIFILAIVAVAVSTFTPLPTMYNNKFFMPPILIPTIVMSDGRWCQIALYLNVIADTLSDLKIMVEKHQLRNFEEIDQETPNIEAYKKVQHFREIYSNVWMITTLMSDCFGWTLIMLLSKVVLEFLNGCYFFYINMGLHQSISLNIRKFRLFLFKPNSFVDIDLILDILLVNGTLVVVFWYICMLSAKCEKMVIIVIEFEMRLILNKR